MKSYLDLIPISARVHRKQNRMTLLCIALSVFLVSAIFGMADMEVRSQRMQAIKDNGNWHAAFEGISDEEARMIAARPEVAAAGRYAVVDGEAYVVKGKRAAIVGMDEAPFQEILGLRVVEGAYPADQDEVALTESAKEVLGFSLGDEARLSHPGGESVFTVTGFIENASSLLMTDEVGLILTTEGLRQAIPGSEYTDQFFVQFSPYSNMRAAIAAITEQFQLEDERCAQNVKLMGLYGQSGHSYMTSLYVTAGVLFVLVLLAGVLMIASSLNSNVAQRTEFFGMMRCLGATPKQIMRFVRREALGWCARSVPAGAFCSVLVVWALCAALRAISPFYFAELPVLDVSVIGIVCGMLSGLLSVLIAARAPARRAASVSPRTAVSGGASEEQPVRRAANTRFLKVDLALGLHHARASRKNFILMTGSFALSIVLFLAFSAAMDFMRHAIRPLQPWTPDVSVVSADEACDVPVGLAERIRENPAVQRAYGRQFAYHIPTTGARGDGEVHLISYEDTQFAWAENSLLEGSVEAARAAEDAVLFVYSGEGGPHAGDSLTLRLPGGDRRVKVAGVLSDSPFGREQGVDQLICSERAFQNLTGERDYTIIDVQLRRGATDADVEALRALAGPNRTFSDRRASNAENRGAYYAMTLFMYGFLFIIALITVIGIVNSVAMSVSGRIRSYGVMRAVGMSVGQLVRMVTMEAAVYAFFGCAAGCALGVPVHAFLYRHLVTAQWGTPWALPLGPLGLIAAFVTFSALLAVRGPARRIRGLTVVETLGAE